MASSVWVSVPIWLTLIRIALAAPRRMPSPSRSVLVTKRSSPTSSHRPPPRPAGPPGDLAPEPLVDGDELVRRPGRSLAGRVVAAVAPQLRRGDVEGEPHVLAGPVTDRLDGPDEHAEGGPGPRRGRGGR